jgi:hypothetical protein
MYTTPPPALLLGGLAVNELIAFWKAVVESVAPVGSAP